MKMLVTNDWLRRHTAGDEPDPPCEVRGGVLGGPVEFTDADWRQLQRVRRQRRWPTPSMLDAIALHRKLTGDGGGGC